MGQNDGYLDARRGAGGARLVIAQPDSKPTKCAEHELRQHHHLPRHELRDSGTVAASSSEACSVPSRRIPPELSSTTLFAM